MNDIHQFYWNVRRMLMAESPLWRDALHTKAYRSKCPGLSFNARDLVDLKIYLYGTGEEGRDDECKELFVDARDKFIIAAYKDLSSLNDPEAMVLFNQLCKLCEFELWEKLVGQGQNKENL